MSDTENVPYEVWENGVLIDSGVHTVTLAPETIYLRDIKADYKAARQQLITANQAVQAASTATAMLPAVKSYTAAANQAFQVLSRAMKYIDGELAGIEE